ncbi:energy transducer TonB [Candidatus Methylospira mobilis]|nr:TonB family protein [Candidatus Methylospira mobilis]
MRHRFKSYVEMMSGNRFSEYGLRCLIRLQARFERANLLPFRLVAGAGYAWGRQCSLCWALGLAFIAHVIVLSAVNFKMPDVEASRSSTRSFEITVFHPVVEAVPEVKKAPVRIAKPPRRKEPVKTAVPIKEAPPPAPRNTLEKFHQANPAPEATLASPPPLHLDASLLAQQVADLGHGYTQQRIEKAREKRIVYVKNTTKDRYEAMEYERACWEKIERIGKLNYPDAARGKDLSGSLRIAVGINQDGGVYSVKILQSSGEQVLDQAAMHIVRLAAPFAPLPVVLGQQVDVLVITGVWDWRFLDNGKPTAR